MPPIMPRKIIDLSPTITPDLPVKMFGTEVLNRMDFRHSLKWDHIVRRPPNTDWKAYVANSFLELPTHGGPHIDGPNHMIEDGPSVADYDLIQCVGPIKIIDVRDLPANEPVPVDRVKTREIVAGDIAVLLTGYVPPSRPGELPRFQFLSPEAATYLSNIPVKAFATDGWSVDSPPRDDRARGAPYVHLAFLPKNIPCIEQLHNIEALVDEDDPIFVGLPLKIDQGNGSPIRAVAFVY